jgi:hypothetical protein
MTRIHDHSSGRRDRVRPPSSGVGAARGVLLALLALVGATGAREAAAQSLATTLARSCDRADAVVQARVLQIGSDALGNRVVVFATQEILRGDDRIASTFVLREPDGEACGRALARTVVGGAHLVFLRATDDPGEPRLLASDARSVTWITPALYDQVGALLASRNDDAARTRALLAGLESPDARVAQDAALALSIQPGLESAVTTAEDRARIARALERGLRDDVVAATALARASQRLMLTESRAALFAALVDTGTASGCEDLLEDALRHLDPDRTWIAARVASRQGAPLVASPTDASPLAAFGDDAGQVLECDASTSRRVARLLAERADRADVRAALAAFVERLEPNQPGVATLRRQVAKTLLRHGRGTEDAAAAVGLDARHLGRLDDETPDLVIDGAPRLRAVRPGAGRRGDRR